MDAQKRALIVEILREIINLNHEQINFILKPFILQTNLQIKKVKKKNDSGMIHLLSIYGDPDTLIGEFEKELGRKQKTTLDMPGRK